jgi:hypothetical protein
MVITFRGTVAIIVVEAVDLSLFGSVDSIGGRLCNHTGTTVIRAYDAKS